LAKPSKGELVDWAIKSKEGGRVDQAMKQ